MSFAFSCHLLSLDKEVGDGRRKKEVDCLLDDLYGVTCHPADQYKASACLENFETTSCWVLCAPHQRSIAWHLHTERDLQCSSNILLDWECLVPSQYVNPPAKQIQLWDGKLAAYKGVQKLTISSTFLFHSRHQKDKTTVLTTTDRSQRKEEVWLL